MLGTLSREREWRTIVKANGDMNAGYGAETEHPLLAIGHCAA